MRPVERPVGVDAVAGGDDVVEAEPVGERLDEVVRSRRGDDHLATRLAVLVDERPGERLDHRRQRSGRGVAGLAHRIACPAPGERGGLPGKRHRRQRLADRVEHGVEQLLAGDRPSDEAGVAHGVGVDAARRPGQQRPIQVEERRSRHQPDCTAATEAGQTDRMSAEEIDDYLANARRSQALHAGAAAGLDRGDTPRCRTGHVLRCPGVQSRRQGCRRVRRSQGSPQLSAAQRVGARRAHRRPRRLRRLEGLAAIRRRPTRSPTIWSKS